MAEKKIICLNHFEITWFSEDNIEFNGHPLGKIIVDGVQFDDGIFLGKTDSPFCLIVGRFVYKTGFDMTVLDAETSTLPLRIMAATNESCENGRYYGNMNLLDPRKEKSVVGTAYVLVEVKNPPKFEYETVKEVFDKIHYATRLIVNTQPLNNFLYQKLLETDPLEHAKSILNYRRSFFESSLNPIYSFVESLDVPDALYRK